MIRPNNVTLNITNIANTDKVRVIKSQPSFEYQDGKVTDRQIGTSYVLLLEKVNFDKISVKTNDMIPVVTNEQIEASADPIYVTFEGFFGKFYFSNQTKNWELSCKADKAILVKQK